MLLKQAAFWHKKSCRPTAAFYCYGSRKSGSQKLEVGSRKSEVRSPMTLLGFRIIMYWDSRLTQRRTLPSSRHALLSNYIINGRIPVSLRRKHRGTRDHCDPNSRLTKSKTIRFLRCSMCDAPSSQAMIKSKEMEMNWLETWLQNHPSVRVFFSLRPQSRLWTLN